MERAPRGFRRRFRSRPVQGERPRISPGGRLGSGRELSATDAALLERGARVSRGGGRAVARTASRSGGGSRGSRRRYRSGSRGERAGLGAGGARPPGLAGRELVSRRAGVEPRGNRRESLGRGQRQKVASRDP